MEPTKRSSGEMSGAGAVVSQSGFLKKYSIISGALVEAIRPELDRIMLINEEFYNHFLQTATVFDVQIAQLKEAYNEFFDLSKDKDIADLEQRLTIIKTLREMKANIENQESQFISKIRSCFRAAVS